MNFFNDVEKIIYRKKTEDPVSLIEYIKFTDEKQKNKCLLFKFKNNLGQILRAITFEVIEFDCHNNKIGKTVFRYNKFEAKGLEVFVPTSKLSVPYETSYVEVRLVNATFETVKYADDEFKTIPYTANDFDKQTKKYQDEDETIKTPKKVVTTPKGSRKTKYKDISSSNKVRAPKALTEISFIDSILPSSL